VSDTMPKLIAIATGEVKPVHKIFGRIRRLFYGVCLGINFEVFANGCRGAYKYDIQSNCDAVEGNNSCEIAA
jgi:hypothetical protein